MANGSTGVIHGFPGFFKVLEDGSIEMHTKRNYVPPGLDPDMGVDPKDVVVMLERGVKAHIFLPAITDQDAKLPVLVHYHGGGFCLGSPFGSFFKYFLSMIATQANVIVVSIDYWLALEHLLLTAYDDSFIGLQWIADHSNGEGPGPWTNRTSSCPLCGLLTAYHADLSRVILAGVNAGATLAHCVAVGAGASDLAGVVVTGLLVHPYFRSKKPDKMYQYMYPTSTGSDDDPKLNPGVDPDLFKLKCDRVMVYVAESEKDVLRSRGITYNETMDRCWCGGTVSPYETIGEDHVLHFFNPTSPNVGPFMEKVVDFIKQQ